VIESPLEATTGPDKLNWSNDAGDITLKEPRTATESSTEIDQPIFVDPEIEQEFEEMVGTETESPQGVATNAKELTPEPNDAWFEHEMLPPKFEVVRTVMDDPTLAFSPIEVDELTTKTEASERGADI
jgi:hypothetical protein